jgi:hypothetical protein
MVPPITELKLSLSLVIPRDIGLLLLHLASNLSGEDFAFSRASPRKHSSSTFALSIEAK